MTAAVGIFDGTLTTIRAHERGADGKPNPTYRCLFPEPPPPGTVPACAEAGILGALTGVLGSMMALEVIREIVGFGEGLVGRLLMIDARAMRFETLQLRVGPGKPAVSGENPTIKDLSASLVSVYISGVRRSMVARLHHRPVRVHVELDQRVAVRGLTLPARCRSLLGQLRGPSPFCRRPYHAARASTFPSRRTSLSLVPDPGFPAGCTALPSKNSVLDFASSPGERLAVESAF